MNAFGIRGQFIILILSICYLLWLSVAANFKISKVDLYIFISLLLILLIPVLWSNNVILGLRRSLMPIMWVLIFLILRESIYKRFSLFLMISLSISFLFLILLYFKAGSPFSIIRDSTIFFRLDDVGINRRVNPIWSARYISYCILVILYIFYFFKNHNKKIIFLKTICLLSLFTFSTYLLLFNSRGPVIALTLTVLTFWFLKDEKRSYITLKLIFVSLGIILFLVYLKIKLPFLRLNLLDNSTLTRFNLISLALEDIDVISFFIGRGSGNFSVLYSIYKVSAHPHNLFVELLYEYGFFSIIFMLIIIFLAISSYRENFSKINFFFLLCFSSALLNAQVSGDLTSNYGVFVFFVLAYNPMKVAEKYFYPQR